jgi:hypothetical protein
VSVSGLLPVMGVPCKDIRMATVEEDCEGQSCNLSDVIEETPCFGAGRNWEMMVGQSGIMTRRHRR